WRSDGSRRRPETPRRGRAPALRTGRSGVLEDLERVRAREVALDPVRRLGRLHVPVRRAHGEYLDEREALALELDAERFAEDALRPGDGGRRVHRAAGDVGRAVDLGDQIRDLDRVAVLLRHPARVHGGLGALAEHAGGGHVPARLAEDAVVEQHGGELLAPGRAVDDLLQTLGDHVAVAL